MALHVASAKGHTATVTILMKAGANVHCKSNKGSGQYTALHTAAAEGHTATVKQLLEAGADVHGNIETTNIDLAGKIETTKIDLAGWMRQPLFSSPFGGQWCSPGQRFVTAAVGCVGTASRDCWQKGLC